MADALSCDGCCCLGWWWCSAQLGMLTAFGIPSCNICQIEIPIIGIKGTKQSACHQPLAKNQKKWNQLSYRVIFSNLNRNTFKTHGPCPVELLSNSSPLWICALKAQPVGSTFLVQLADPQAIFQWRILTWQNTGFHMTKDRFSRGAGTNIAILQRNDAQFLTHHLAWF